MKLGSIEFEDYEVPAAINFGGRQSLVTHRLGNGLRVIDLLGPDSDNITFSGTFSGSNALSRAKSVDSLRKKGVPIDLRWGELSYEVLVSRFSANFMNELWIPYKCTCAVISTGIGGSSPSSYSSGSPSLGTSISTTVASLLESVPGMMGLFANADMSDYTPTAADNLSQVQADVNRDLATGVAQLDGNLELDHQSLTAAVSSLGNLEAAMQTISLLTAARSYLHAAQSGLVIP